MNQAISGAFLTHGLGMVGGAVAIALAREGAGFGRSWLLARAGRPLETAVGVLLWGAAGIGFIVAAIGFFRYDGYWMTAAWVGAPATVAAIVLWAGVVPTGTYVGGLLAWASSSHFLGIRDLNGCDEVSGDNEQSEAREDHLDESASVCSWAPPLGVVCTERTDQ